MKLIAAIEDRNGLMFNKRRLSRDRVVTEKILELTKGARLLVHPYSLDLFPDAESDEDFLAKAGEDDFCLVEDCSVKEYLDKIEEVNLFRWNRKYPADLYFDLPMEPYELVHEEEFEGFSHEKITCQKWRRKK